MQELIQNSFSSGLQEGIRLSLFVFGISFTWRIARIPDLSSYSSYLLGGVIAGLVYQLKMNSLFECVLGHILSIIVGALIGYCVFVFWRILELNILVIGILFGFVAFSISSLLMGFNPEIQTSDLLQESASIENFSILPFYFSTVVVVIFLCVFFQSTIGSNLFVWCRSNPLGEDRWKKSWRSPNMLALILGSIFVTTSGFMISRDNGEFSLLEGKDLLFIGLIMLIIGETIIVVLRFILLPFSGKFIFFLRRRVGFIYPLLIIIGAPLGSITYWFLVSLSDKILRMVLSNYSIDKTFPSGLSRGLVAVFALGCLLILRIFARKGKIYESWQFQQ